MTFLRTARSVASHLGLASFAVPFLGLAPGSSPLTACAQTFTDIADSTNSVPGFGYGVGWAD